MPGVFERLQVLCPDHSAVASAVELVLNQRLIRRLCRKCSGAGCSACLQTGYRGRAPVVEWIKPDDAQRHAIRRQDFQALTPQRPLAAIAEDLVRQGITSEAEFQRVFSS